MEPEGVATRGGHWLRARWLVPAVALLALVAPATIGAPAPTGKVVRIAIMRYPTGTTPQLLGLIDVFWQALRGLGWVEGQNVAIDLRSTEYEQLPELAAQIVREKYDLIVTTATPAALAAKDATGTVPIVMAVSADPVGGGVTGSIAHPGGNITGLTLVTPEITGKRLELLKEMVPRLRRVTAVVPERRDFPVVARWIKENEIAARTLGLGLQVADVAGPDKWDAAVAALKRDGVGAATLVEGPRYIVEAPEIAGAALKHRLPTIFPFREQVEAGGLMSYGANIADMWRRAATLVDKILRGAKPGDLPIEQPTKFELVINARTARALGLTIPSTLLLRATEGIQ